MSMIWQSLNQGCYKRTSNKWEAQYPYYLPLFRARMRLESQHDALLSKSCIKQRSQFSPPLINDNYWFLTHLKLMVLKAWSNVAPLILILSNYFILQAYYWVFENGLEVPPNSNEICFSKSYSWPWNFFFYSEPFFFGFLKIVTNWFCIEWHYKKKLESAFMKQSYFCFSQFSTHEIIFLKKCVCHTVLKNDDFRSNTICQFIVTEKIDYFLEKSSHTIIVLFIFRNYGRIFNWSLNLHLP